MSDPTIRDFLFEHETDVHLAYYGAIGRVIVGWSMLESQWDINMLTLFLHLRGNEIAKVPAVSMSRKIDFWNNCFNRLPALSPKKEAAIKFAARMEVCSSERNLMLHTNWGNVLSADNFPAVIGGGMRIKGATFTHYNASMSIESLGKLLHEIASLQALMLPLTFFLVQLSNNR